MVNKLNLVQYMFVAISTKTNLFPGAMSKILQIQEVQRSPGHAHTHHTPTPTYTYTHTHIHPHTHLHTHLHTHTPTVYTHIQTHTHTYTHVYTPTHPNTPTDVHPNTPTNNTPYTPSSHIHAPRCLTFADHTSVFSMCAVVHTVVVMVALGQCQL